MATIKKITIPQLIKKVYPPESLKIKVKPPFRPKGPSKKGTHLDSAFNTY